MNEIYQAAAIIYASKPHINPEADMMMAVHEAIALHREVRKQLSGSDNDIDYQS